MQETVQDVDFLRLLHSDLSKRGADFDSYIKAESEAELLSEGELRAMYS